jgi:hypothetical protein
MAGAIFCCASSARRSAGASSFARRQRSLTPGNSPSATHSWIGDYATLYTLGEIRIGENVCISQHCYLASAYHDYTKTHLRYDRQLRRNRAGSMAGDAGLHRPRRHGRTRRSRRSLQRGIERYSAGDGLWRAILQTRSARVRQRRTMSDARPTFGTGSFCGVSLTGSKLTGVQLTASPLTAFLLQLPHNLLERPAACLPGHPLRRLHSTFGESAPRKRLVLQRDHIVFRPRLDLVNSHHVAFALRCDLNTRSPESPPPRSFFSVSAVPDGASFFVA